MRDERIFIAIDISDEARRVCSDHIDSLRQPFQKVRIGWERPEKLHITLKFLGDTPGRVLDSLCTSVTEIASRYRPSSLRLSGPGVFPSPSKPRIMWIGVEDESNVTPSLYKDLDTICSGHGFKSDDRKFHPHITIGRIREPEKARKVVNEHLAGQLEPVEFEVAEIIIYKSDLQPAGSVYSQVSRAKFRIS